MQPAYFSATVIAVTVTLSTLVLILFRWMSSLLKETLKVLQRATDLAASKDLTTFQALQVTKPVQSLEELDEQVHPLNDAVAAEQLAKQFEAQGLDPSLAYADDDDVSFVNEFGLSKDFG